MVSLINASLSSGHSSGQVTPGNKEHLTHGDTREQLVRHCYTTRNISKCVYIRTCSQIRGSSKKL